MVKDMVCGMGVEEDDPTTLSTVVWDKTYFFCSAECLLLFRKAPQEYINQQPERKDMVEDLVCGMEVDMNNPPFMAEHRGTFYYFCSNACRLEFLYNPGRFVEKSHVRD